MGYPKPDEANGYQRNHVKRMRNNLIKLGGVDLFDFDKAGVIAAKKMFHAPFGIFSFDNAEKPVFTYANLTALELFDTSWEELTQMTIDELMDAESWKETINMIANVKQKGALPNYSGKRVSKTGKQFNFENGIIWNLLDEFLTVDGQAVVFANWNFDT